MSDMTGRSTQEADGIDAALGLSATVVLVAAVLGWAILVGSFLFKVWNERQMTHAYDRQAVALERIADASERAHPPKCLFVPENNGGYFDCPPNGVYP